MTTAKAIKTKMTIIAVGVAFIIVVASVAAYFTLFYNNITDHFTLSLQYDYTEPSPYPSQIFLNEQVSVWVSVNYNSHDHITLTTSGTGASWARFLNPSFHPSAPVGDTWDYGLSQLTITDGTKGAELMISVPEDANTGNYYITITGTNSAGITSSVTYSFSVP
jgi:hypothetical protein